MKHWYVVQTRAGQERAVSRGIEFIQIEMFYPTFIRRVTVGRRQEDVARPLFPLYLFAAFDVDKRSPTLTKNWGNILRIPGVNTILGLRGRPHADERREMDEGKLPIPIPERVVLALKAEAELHGGHIPLREYRPEPLKRLSPGDKVVVIEGPLDGMIGIVDKDQKHRVRVLLDFLGKERTTLIPREALRLDTATSVSSPDA